MDWKPQSKDELRYIIEEIITSQNSMKYKYGLKDIDVSNITDMEELFSCYGDDIDGEINKLIDWKNPKNDITQWNVSNVTDMSEMFYDTSFNQPIGNWDVSHVTNMTEMFAYSEFNHPLNSWNVSSVENMSWMFAYSKFNQSIGNWNVSNVRNMSNMFYSSPFNQPIGYWNVSNVTNMASMFADSPFDQDISDWNVNNITSMSYMFAYSPFDQPVDNWDIGNVIKMDWMFSFSKFDKNLYKWIDKLNSDIDLNNFNNNSIHKEIFGSINSVEEFIDNQLTPEHWIKEYRSSSDKDRFELLKLLKNRDKDFIDNLKELINNNNIDINI